MKGAMSRNLYLLAASLLLFSLVSCAMSLIPNSLQPGLPVNGSGSADGQAGSPPVLEVLPEVPDQRSGTAG